MRKRTTKDIGDAAERYAQAELRRAGYRVLETNYAVKGGEVDVVAAKERAVVFVEVRSRSRDDFGSPLESIGYGKQRRLTRAAVAYLKQRRISDTSWRFDVVEVILGPDGEPVSAEIIENAFEARGIF